MNLKVSLQLFSCKPKTFIGEKGENSVSLVQKVEVDFFLAQTVLYLILLLNYK